MKWLERKREKKELQRLFDTVEDEKLDRFMEWDNMLYIKNKITILEADTAEGISLKWDDFLLQNNKRDNRLGALLTIDDTKHSVDNGIHYLQIEYRQYCLQEGFELNDYKKALAEYERSKIQLDELREKLKTFV
ncbi:hypothetical protein [Rummeliibacillus stabekisii]|uniref:hypothetical protein n=1 Tax=Rummeliibacillus stabekisii TaxID=241244 RepID=UPI0037126C86